MSDSTNTILERLAEIGILGKTKTEIATRIITDWIWNNEDRLIRNGIPLRQKRNGKKKQVPRHKQTQI